MSSLPVCSQAYLRNCTSDLQTNCLILLYLWSRPGRPLAAFRHVMYFRFYGRRHICTWWRHVHTTAAIDVTACCRAQANSPAASHWSVEGRPLSSRLEGLGERREVPQWGPERSSARKRIFCIFIVTERFYVTHTHTRLTALCPGLPRWASTRKVKPIWILLKQEKWQWNPLGHIQLCTSLQTDNHARTPPLSFFTGRMPFLPPNQQHQSTESFYVNVCKRLSCLCRVWCELKDCSERVQTSNFLSATASSCRESNSHRRSGRDTLKTVLSCLAWRCEWALK